MDILLLITENLTFSKSDEYWQIDFFVLFLDQVISFKNWYFCDHSSRNKLSFFETFISTCHNQCKSIISIQFVISWIWGWKITNAWPNFDFLWQKVDTKTHKQHITEKVLMSSFTFKNKIDGFMNNFLEKCIMLYFGVMEGYIAPCWNILTELVNLELITWQLQSKKIKLLISTVPKI